MVTEKGIDPRRVFVTGLSAGGAMTSVLLACYPEVFAAGAIIAGLPFGAASNVQQAFESMFQSPSRSAQAWGDLVRAAAPHHNGPWPRISVWHGNADKTVVPSNANEILKQWTDVHRLSPAPSAEATVDGYPRKVWVDVAGDEIIESYTIADMAHGTPLATGQADSECGAAGPFLLEVGISSSYHIAKFFGLTFTRTRPVFPMDRIAASTVRVPADKIPDSGQPAILNGEILEEGSEDVRSKSLSSGIDIGAVITKALETAGLLPRR
jgi:poly(3-hydroxybutyrate) depolymerase